ncbi:hypothetical protein V1477_018362 [Vespula maculifrons]|uniref:Uncharacterized protein n=1 Tax=Vespula maculifrons TaxID=7453 RepID=A0ABD2AZ81_VESMC
MAKRTISMSIAYSTFVAAGIEATGSYLARVRSCAEETSSCRARLETYGRWHLLLNRQIPVFTFFASNAVVNWHRAHGGRSSYKAKCPQPDPATTGILPFSRVPRLAELYCLVFIWCLQLFHGKLNHLAVKDVKKEI